MDLKSSWELILNIDILAVMLMSAYLDDGEKRLGVILRVLQDMI